MLFMVSQPTRNWCSIGLRYNLISQDFFHIPKLVLCSILKTMIKVFKLVFMSLSGRFSTALSHHSDQNATYLVKYVMAHYQYQTIQK